MRKFVFFSLFLMFLPIASAEPVSDSQVSKVVKLMIYSTKDKEYTVSGSGVRINPDGDILTNYHVVESLLNPLDKHLLTICFTENEKTLPQCDFSGEVIDYDVQLDLALIKVTDHLGFPSKPDLYPVESRKKTPISEYYAEQKIETHPYFEFDRSDDKNIPQLGEEVHILGYPGDSSEFITFTKGDVSGFEQVETRLGDQETLFFRTDAILRPGNSGGAALNANNKFIGIPSATNENDEFTGYVIATPFILGFLYDAEESTRAFCGTPIDDKTPNCSCNPGLGYMSLQGQSQGTCEFNKPADCGLNARMYNGTKAKNDCICNEGFEWKLYSHDETYCAVRLIEEFPVHEHLSFGKDTPEMLGRQLELRSGVTETNGAWQADFIWNVLEKEFQDAVAKYTFTVFSTNGYRLRKPENILTRKVDFLQNAFSFPIEPDKTYYLEIIGGNERGDDILILRFEVKVGHDINDYTVLTHTPEIIEPATSIPEVITHEELAKKKRRQFINMIVDSKKTCELELTDPYLSRDCFREKLKQKFLEYVQRKRVIRYECQELNSGTQEREHCELQKLVDTSDNS